MSGIVGTSSAALCAVLASLLIKKMGRNYSLIILSTLNICAALYFWWISGMEPSVSQVYAGICLLWGVYGTSSVIIYTTSMDMVRPGASGTDFTIQIVITHLGSLIVAVSSGKVADILGYSGLFGVEVGMGVLTLLIIVFAMPKKQVS
jgi:predicted MFS family arabinose efflux permease